MTKYTDYSPYVPGLQILDVTYVARLDRTFALYETPDFGDMANLSGCVPESQLRALIHSHADEVIDGRR